MAEHETHSCTKCRKATTWVTGRGRARCQGCGTEYPCVKCRHWDCMEARGEAVADAAGILRLVTKTSGAVAAPELDQPTTPEGAEPPCPTT